ncbi:hypothetical protein PC116_g27020 [Phytophthora cactorum]|nr:hypothetical protein PC116_g27020 [Phytophthora cactorum]
MNDREPELQVPPDTWTPPPIDVEWHETWEDFSAYIAQPQEQTNQIFRQRTSTSIAKRNREILERAARRAGGAVQSGHAERGDDAATESVDGCEEGADRFIPAKFNNFWVNLGSQDEGETKGVCYRGRATRSGSAKGRGNRASVFVDDVKTAQTITLQTRQMRRWFKAFPEAMLVDAMHNTNEWRYKLFSFMVNDVYSHSQYVYHSPMENESAECLTDAIGSFKFQNTMWEKIKVIVIDKDVGELGVLEKQFPGVRIILCHFHLKKYIRTEMVKSEYGGPSSFDRDQVEDAVYMMRLAASPEEYTKLESLWGHISNILRADMALDECVDTLMFLQAVAEMEYSKKTMDVGQMRYDGADAELKKRPREVSPYAYRLIEQQ